MTHIGLLVIKEELSPLTVVDIAPAILPSVAVTLTPDKLPWSIYSGDTYTPLEYSKESRTTVCELRAKRFAKSKAVRTQNFRIGRN